MILVTGASGLLGANFALTARREFSHITAVYNRSAIGLAGVECIQADLCSIDLELWLRNLRPEWIIHCLSLTDVNWCQEHGKEAMHVNVEVPRSLAITANKIGSRFVYISTDSVFNGKQGNYHEDDTPCPVNLYAQTKLDGERAVINSVADAIIIRTNIYGWNIQDKQSLSEWMLDKLESNQILQAFADVFFSPILVNDLSEIIIEMMKQGLKGVYNVCGSQFCSKYEFAQCIADTFNLNRKLIRSVSVGDILCVPRPRNTTLNVTKISRDLNQEMPDLETGLKRFKTLRDSGFVATLKKFRKEI